jgi:hypothetical protein
VSKIAEEQQRWIERQREQRERAIAEAKHKIDLIGAEDVGVGLEIRVERRDPDRGLPPQFGMRPNAETFEYELPPAPPVVSPEGQP